MERKFVAYFYATGFTDISLGIHFSLSAMNMEIHVPFGFFRVGFDVETITSSDIKSSKWVYRKYGLH